MMSVVEKKDSTAIITSWSCDVALEYYDTLTSEQRFALSEIWSNLGGYPNLAHGVYRNPYREVPRRLSSSENGVRVFTYVVTSPKSVLDTLYKPSLGGVIDFDQYYSYLSLTNAGVALCIALNEETRNEVSLSVAFRTYLHYRTLYGRQLLTIWQEQFETQAHSNVYRWSDAILVDMEMYIKSRRCDIGFFSAQLDKVSAH